MEEYINKITHGDCVEVLKKIPNDSVDLVITSPPYNVGIDYDEHVDDISMEDYWDFTRKWLKGVYDTLKDDGRVAINIPYEINVRERGGRIFFVSEFYQIMKEIGFGFFGLVDLDEDSPHRSKTTAWGSWMSPSAPYIYNPKECVVLGYKKDYKKKVKGEPQWSPAEIKMVEKTNGEGMRKRVEYSESDKKEFMSLVFGQWNYFADTNQLTKATFSMDIPVKAIKILSYQNDIVMDPFSGSGTTAVACMVHNRRFIGIELSEKYVKQSEGRLNKTRAEIAQVEINYEKG
jgi:site-specific DNA-methyltransferase (adenine-specific)